MRMLLITLLTLAMAACGDEGSLAQGGDDDDGQTLVRAVHASRDAPQLRLSVDGAFQGSDLVFGTVGTAVEVDSGDRTIAFHRATDTDDILFQATLNLPADGRLSMILFGSLGADDLRLSVVDESTANPDEGEAAIRFLNAIFLTADTWNASLEADGDVLVADADYGVWQAPVTVQADGATAYSLVVRNQDGNTVTLPEILTPENGQLYLVLAAGILGDGVADTDPSLEIVSAMEE